MSGTIHNTCHCAGQQKLQEQLGVVIAAPAVIQRIIVRATGCAPLAHLLKLVENLPGI